MALSWLSLLVAGLVGIVAGTLIGCIGVGGVVLVPLLLLRPDIKVHIAVVACMAAYMPAGLGGALAYVRKGAVPWRSTILMCLPSILSALLGSWTLVQMSGHLVKVILYSVMLATSCLSALRSIHAAWNERISAKYSPEDRSCRDFMESEDREDGEGCTSSDRNNEDVGESGELLTEGSCDPDPSSPVRRLRDESPRNWSLFGSMTFAELLQALAVGTLTGFGSALTGTSGPVLLLPMLFIFLWPALPALGCAQVIQVPIALAATIGNVFFVSSDIDLTEVFKLAGCVAAGLVPFVFVGAAIASYLPQKALKISVALLLVVASLVLLLREVL